MWRLFPRKKITLKDCINYGRIDLVFFFTFLAILFIGVVMLFSATYPYAYRNEDGDSLYFVKGQLIGIAAGSLFMLVCSKINYKFWGKFIAVFGTIVTIILLILALMGTDYNGTHRTIDLGFFTIQPSDLAKFTIILTFAYILDVYHEDIVGKKSLKGKYARAINEKAGHNIFNTSLPPIMLCGFILVAELGLIILGSHLSGMILVFCIGVTCLSLGEVRHKWFVIGFCAVAIVVLILVSNPELMKKYMLGRITNWLDKDADPYGERWQTNQALYAIGSGGFFGKGLGKSMQKFLYVSEPQNDMIFSIVVEELGFLGAAVIILLFMVLVWRGVVIGVNSDTRYGAIVAIGIAVHLGLQVFLNLMVATDSLPNTGITLPFFSYGRMAIVINMGEIGMVLNISRTSRLKNR